MLTKNKLIPAGIILLLIASPIIWWLTAPLFQDDLVDESFPFDVPTMEEIDEMSPEEAETAVIDLMGEVNKHMADMDEDAMKMVEKPIIAMAEKMPDHPMDEPMPEPTAVPETSNEWVVAAKGDFQDADAFHQGSGSATIFQQGESRILRFEQFKATNGPDLHVLLVENINATSHDEIGTYVDLGSLKGNVGNQNYEIPADIDLSLYSGVMIYCQPFHVVFATAAWK